MKWKGVHHSQPYQRKPTLQYWFHPSIHIKGTYEITVNGSAISSEWPSSLLASISWNTGLNRSIMHCVLSIPKIWMEIERLDEGMKRNWCEMKNSKNSKIRWESKREWHDNKNGGKSRSTKVIQIVCGTGRPIWYPNSSNTTHPSPSPPHPSQHLHITHTTPHNTTHHISTLHSPSLFYRQFYADYHPTTFRGVPQSHSTTIPSIYTFPSNHYVSTYWFSPQGDSNGQEEGSLPCELDAPGQEGGISSQYELMVCRRRPTNGCTFQNRWRGRVWRARSHLTNRPFPRARTTRLCSRECTRFCRR